MRKKINYKKLLITGLLLLLLVIIFYLVIGIFVSGPANKNASDDQKMFDQIKASNKKCETVSRHSFKFVTYTCESSKEYIIYDKDGKKIAARDKSDSRFSEVETLIAEKYPRFENQKIEVSYGKDSVVYMIENEGDFLLIDFDSLDVLFNSEG